MAGKSIGGVIRDIGEEVRQERDRQVRLWGLDFDARNTANDWAAYITAYVGKATYSGRGEEFTPERFRANMMKVAAIAQAAVLQIDLNGNCAARHYEGQPRSGAREEHDQTNDGTPPLGAAMPKIRPDCIHCGHAMGEREGVPLCPKCGGE